MTRLPSIQSVSENSRGLLMTLAYAALAAGSAIAFLWLTNLVFHVGIEKLSTLSLPTFVLGSLAVVTSTSLVAGILMVRAAPDAAGSGVPQLKASYWKDLGFVGLRGVLVKFFAGILTLGGGTSLGREGPSVFVGGGGASALSAAFGVAKTARRRPAATGAAAALAAAFNTPLASITFVMEEMLNNEFGSRVLGAVVLAAVTGALLVHAVLGPQPAFSMASVDTVTWRMYVILPIVAAAASLIGVAFHSLTLRMRRRVRERSRLPRWLQPAVGGVATWALAVGAFLLTRHIGVFGLGYGDLSLALNDGLAWQAAGVLVAAKFAATVLSYSWGGCGGIFSPTLFLGGLTGFFLAGAAGTFFPLTGADRIVLAAVGMSACFNAVVRAPLTALLIVFEMTHQFAMVPALMVCTIVSQAIARIGGKHNFYDALLVQDGHELIRIKPPRDLGAWHQLPVSEIARTSPVILHDLQAGTIREALARHPYSRFPVMRAGSIVGVMTRRDAEEAQREGRPPRLERAVFCSPETTVHQVAELLMDSPSGIVLVTGHGGAEISALVTLHDLLRAQAAVLE